MPHTGQEAHLARASIAAALDAFRLNLVDVPSLRAHLAAKAGTPPPGTTPRTVRELAEVTLFGLEVANHILEPDRNRGAPLVSYELGHGRAMNTDGITFAVFLTLITAHGLEVTVDLDDTETARELARGILLNALEVDLHNSNGAGRCHDDDAPAPPVLAAEDRDLAVAWLRDRANLLDAEALLDDEHRAEGCARAAELRTVADLIGTNAHHPR